MAAGDPSFATRTTTKLLDALHDPANEPVWRHIDSRYRGVIAALAKRLGAGDADADDVAQQTLAEFIRCYRDGRYDRAKGRLSSWILAIAHHTTLGILRRKRALGAASPSEIDERMDEGTLRSIWTDERDRLILGRAMEILREESDLDERTLMAFELSSLRGVPVAETASQTGMTPEQVYVAKSRVTKRLRALVEELTSAFEEDA
ncbi:MAG TPA: sigma-70 family RNA polymerase sigma factor [Phycisphaerales bacterium]|nr:sigma-70 family RNA polymerase sigma factor [Phycisphaerales bacterium]